MKKQPQNKRKRRFIILIILVLCIGSIAYLLFPSQEKMTHPNYYKTVTTTFYSTEVPADYRIKKAVDPNNLNLETLLARAGPKNGVEIGITTNLMPPGGLLGIPDYNLRVSKPNDYALLNNEALSEGSKLFQDLRPGKNEYLLYMVHDDRFASILVKGDAPPAKLLELIKHTEESWRWL